MVMFTEFLLQYKDVSEIQHFKLTIPYIQDYYEKCYDSLSDTEKIKTDNILKEFYELINYKK